MTERLIQIAVRNAPVELLPKNEDSKSNLLIYSVEDLFGKPRPFSQNELEMMRVYQSFFAPLSRTSTVTLQTETKISELGVKLLEDFDDEAAFPSFLFPGMDPNTIMPMYFRGTQHFEILDDIIKNPQKYRRSE